VEGMEFSCRDIVVLPVKEPVDTNNCVETDPPPVIESEPETDTDTEPVTDVEPEPETSLDKWQEPETTQLDPEEELELLLKELGCSSVMEAGSLTALLALAAAAYAIRKRK
jgi:hypothetical protein